MARESIADKTARARKITGALERVYPHAHCELNYANPLELLVATILSAQCTDKRVNLVTADLFQKYHQARDFAEADLATLEKDIRSTGFYKNKARNIKSACAAIVSQHGGLVPRTMEELIPLGGRRPQDRQRGAGQRLWHQCGRGGGYAYRPAIAAARAHRPPHAGKNRSRI